MSLLGIRRLGPNKWEVTVGWGVYVVPTLGDAIRLKMENL